MAGKSYTVLVDKLGKFSKGAIVPEEHFGQNVDRLLRKNAIREATDEEISSGKATFSDERSATAVSLEQQLADAQKKIALLEQELDEGRAQLAEYRQPGGADRNANVFPKGEGDGDGTPAGDTGESGKPGKEGKKGEEGKPPGAPPPPPPPSGKVS